MLVIELNRHRLIHTEFVGLFQIIGDDDFAGFFEGDEIQIEDFVEQEIRLFVINLCLQDF
ncbi:hypothetical protein ACFL3P_04100 [Pseudomonadota bacterium]